MSKRTIIYIKKTDPENPQRQEAVYIHDDLVAKAIAGERSSPKVSDIRFDGGPKQEWVAVLRDGRELCRNKDRGVVVQMEADIIAKMFARGEYIPGGYNGEPRHEVEDLRRDSRYLGRHEEFDLHATDVGHYALCNGPFVFRFDLIPEDEDYFRSLPEKITPQEAATPLLECIRRNRIEMEIEREEKIKTQHHA